MRVSFHRVRSIWSPRKGWDGSRPVIMLGIVTLRRTIQPNAFLGDGGKFCSRSRSLMSKRISTCPADLEEPTCLRGYCGRRRQCDLRRRKRGWYRTGRQLLYRGSARSANRNGCVLWLIGSVEGSLVSAWRRVRRSIGMYRGGRRRVILGQVGSVQHSRTDAFMCILLIT